MESVGRETTTDKVLHHHYHKYYERYLQPFYDKDDGALLEIGIENGHSLQMWLKLFPRLYIYGIDKNLEENGERHSIFRCDQSKQDNLEKTLAMMDKKLHVIIDDGSHIPEHQLLTFNMLFPRLETGGIYIIEDIETSYWKKGSIYGYPVRYGIHHPKSIIEIFKSHIDCVNIEFCKKYYKGIKLQHTQYIESIVFSRNCIIIIKGEPNTREYRFQSYL